MTSEPYLPVQPFYVTPNGQPTVEACNHVAIPRSEHLQEQATLQAALRTIADLQCAKPCDPVLAEAKAAYAKVIQGCVGHATFPSWPTFLAQWRARTPKPSACAMDPWRNYIHTAGGGVIPWPRDHYKPQPCQYVPTDAERAQRITDAAVAFQEAVVAAREAGLVVDWNVSYDDQGRGWMDGARPHCIIIRDISRPLLPKVTKP